MARCWSAATRSADRSSVEMQYCGRATAAGSVGTGPARQLTMRSLSSWARRAWIAGVAPAGGSVPVTVTVLRPSHEGLLTPTILTPGWHQGSGQLVQHADVYACGGKTQPPRWS
jgi:hypothetical protein